MVREDIQRENYRELVPSLKEFIDGLRLQITITEPLRDQFSRISQLTMRTNQFNFTTLRRSEMEIARYLANETGRCLATHVSDRFGDYGTVGLILYSAEGDRCRVDTFLLSCRVLGRGVEHRILAELGQRALSAGTLWVELPFRPTDKNQPAWEFAHSVGAEFMLKTDDGFVFRFPSEKLVGLRYEPCSASLESPKGRGVRATKPVSSEAFENTVRIADWSEKIQRIAESLNGAKQIWSAIEAHRMRSYGLDEAIAHDLPATVEGRVLRIWRKVIGNPQVGVNDRFFDIGGTSLKAVQIVAAIRRELNLPLSVVNLLECPTVRLLCERLQNEERANDRTNEAMARGTRRKQRAKRLAE
jgi:hypothetical protein